MGSQSKPGFNASNVPLGYGLKNRKLVVVDY